MDICHHTWVYQETIIIHAVITPRNTSNQINIPILFTAGSIRSLAEKAGVPRFGLNKLIHMSCDLDKKCEISKLLVIVSSCPFGEDLVRLFERWKNLTHKKMSVRILGYSKFMVQFLLFLFACLLFVIIGFFLGLHEF